MNPVESHSISAAAQGLIGDVSFHGAFQHFYETDHEHS
jgi:hypothetical protein